MKKVLAFLLAFLMSSSVLLVNAFAIEVTSLDDENVKQFNTDCTCGGSYGEWLLPDNGVCVGGRYYRVCEDCDNVQTAKDVTPKTILFTVPAIGANVGDLVMLSLYDVYFTSSAVKSAKDIVWSSEDIEIVNNQICPTEAGTYKLTATAGTSTKSVYLVVKNPTDTEYVLFYDGFDRDAALEDENGRVNLPTKGNAGEGDYEVIQQPSGTSAYTQDGKLVLDTLGNANNQMRVILPKWIGDFGEYKIDTVFTIDSTVSNDTSRWFATMARVKNDSDYFPIWQAAVRKAAKSHSSGVEISYTGNGINWEVPCKGKYTENIDAAKFYTQTLNIVGTEAYHSINGTLIQSTEKASKHLGTGVGLVGFHLRASLVYIDSIKIVVPIDDSIHNFGDWVTVTADTCTTDGLEKRTCVNCDVTEERVIAKGHKIVSYAVKAPSCTESGYRAYDECQRCDYTTFSGEFGPFGHYFDREIKSIAHRGFSNVAPENTLPAYILAKEKGFSYVECDVAFTKDGVAVLLHDTTIDRTSDGTGNISELTYEELLQYDFGSWKSSKYAGTKIPTFEEFIALCKEEGLHPYIEIKNDGETYTQEQVQSLVDIVEEYGMEDTCTWISFNITYLEYVKNVDDTARLGYVSSKSITQSLINPVLALQTGKNEVFLDISYNMLNENNVMLAMENGLPLETWTVDNTNDIKQRPKYISGYTSNKLIATDTLVKTAVVAPTCGAEGYTIYTCLCGATKNDNYVPATEEHTYENGVCTGCGKALYCADSTHNLEIISISYANGYDKPGLKVVKCLDCNAMETETQAPALYSFIGYAVRQDGRNGISVGFEVNTDALAKYEEATGKTVEIGVVFAGYDNLAGKQPLDENGKTISLEKGKVIKSDLSEFDYKIYDFVLNDIDDSIKDVNLVIAAYIYDGEGVEYLQENGASDTVSGISYNDVVERMSE